MTRISNLTAIDSRSVWEKIPRRQFWKGAKALNIPFPAGATQPQMISICQAAGVTPEQVAKFIPVRVNTADGNGKVVMVPEDHERKYDPQKEHRRMEEMERRIAAGVEKEETRISAAKQKMETEKNVEIQGLKTELEDLKAMMQKLLTQGTEQNTEVRTKPLTTEKEPVPPETPKEVDPYKMKFMAQRKWLKARGVELKKGDNPATLIDEVYNAPKSLTGS